MPTRKIAAFSYFYDRAVDAGMLKHGESAVVQVQDIPVHDVDQTLFDSILYCLISRFKIS